MLPYGDALKHPAHAAQDSDPARRFTWLVDVFYDDRVNLIVSAAAAAEAEGLFTAGEHAAEFQRTVGWLHEMQSVEYLRTERRDVSEDAQLEQRVPSR